MRWLWIAPAAVVAFACSAGDGGGEIAGGGAIGAGANAGSAGVGAGAGAGGSAAKGGSAGNDASTGSGGSSASSGFGGADAGFPDVNFYYDAPVIQPEACASTIVEGKLTPLDLYFMLDTSGSMGSKMSALRGGVVNFANGAGAAGIFVTGQRFPIGGFNETCASNAYATPAVPWGALPYGAFTSWVNGLNATGYTPSVPALQGAVDACKARIAAQPTHKCVVVFVTDGNPEGNCAPTGSSAQTPLGNIAAGAFAVGIPVFAIGFPGLPPLGQGIINHVAQQGGTSSAFIISGNNIGAQFTTQLQAIQNKTLGCEYVMPTTTKGVIDPNKVTVTFTPGAGGSPQTIGRVANAAACGPNGGWYYDNPAAPKLIKLCPTTCTAVQADSKAKVEINLGCLGS